MKYAIVVTLFIIIVAGAYCFGYNAGKSNAIIEKITEEKEVIRYVYKESSEIYSKPHIGRDSALRLFNEGRL